MPIQSVHVQLMRLNIFSKLLKLVQCINSIEAVMYDITLYVFMVVLLSLVYVFFSSLLLSL